MMNRSEAMQLLDWAHDLNPGPWRAHSLQVARVTEAVAERLGLDKERAWLSGALHDIGRYEGVRGMHHVIAGYRLLMQKGEAELARICMTHSFPLCDLSAYQGKRDVTDEEYAFLQQYLRGCTYDDYDRLGQLGDAMALPSGVCLIEKRLVDVALRYGVNERLIEKWKAVLQIREDFEARMGCSVYALFDDVAGNTFGLDFVKVQAR